MSKLTFEPANSPQREPVAYMDRDGDLVFKCDDIRLVDTGVYVSSSGLVTYYCEWDPFGKHNNKMFYAGDSVTINF